MIIDVDAHYFENPREFAKYLDEPWRTRILNWTGSAFAPMAGTSREVDARFGGRANREVAGVGGGGHPTTRQDILNVMKYLGVDVSVLVPNTLLGFSEISDKRRAVAFANGFVDYMLNEVVSPEDGIYTLILAPNQSPTEAADLILRTADHDGIAGVLVMNDRGLTLPLGDSYYDPIYSACCEKDLTLVLHAGYGGPEGAQSGFGLQSYTENHIAFVLNSEIQLTSVVMQGLPERFPKLRILFEEAGVFWIPLMMYRLDGEYSISRTYLPYLKKPPSEYIKNFYFGTQPLENTPEQSQLKSVFDMIGGENNLLFATDWPHGDFDSPYVIQKLAFLSDEAKAKILGKNAQKILRFKKHQNKS